jgi:hypothetical protein
VRRVDRLDPCTPDTARDIDARSIKEGYGFLVRGERLKLPSPLTRMQYTHYAGLQAPPAQYEAVVLGML